MRARAEPSMDPTLVAHAMHASVLPTPAPEVHSPTGIPYCVAGQAEGGARGIQEIPQQELHQLLQHNSTAASYFKMQQLMFYFPPGP